MSDVLNEIVKVSAIVFVLSSMLAMGLSMTIPQIVSPLKNIKLVIVALAINFIAIPLLVWGIQAVMGLDQDIYTGLLLLATAAGAPFLPKLAQTAKGDTAFSVGLMVMLMVVTIIYMPIVLPLFLSGVEINPWDIAKSLIVAMLLPLGIGLFMKARWSELAGNLQPPMASASSYSVLLMLVGGIVLAWDNVTSLFGTGAIIAIVVFILLSLAIGYVAGGWGSTPEIRSVMALGTAQRNVSAAMVVGAMNFSDSPNVLIVIVAVALIGLVLLAPIGAEMGKRSIATGAPGADG
ncbi:MAG: bile acid:sodium symporter [Actinomycetota bacterium]|nr:bile acid:sodium symporter [Actinomycetota bacterium]